MATAHTDTIVRRMQARQLAGAIAQMADRYAESDRKGVYASRLEVDHWINGNDQEAAEMKAESERHDRARLRRRAALVRLTNALAQMAVA